MSPANPKPVLLCLTAFLGVLPSVGFANVLLYDFETDDQHRENSTAANPPGWGSFGTITLDRGANNDASAGARARFHAGDFDLPADLPGNFGLIDVSDRFTPYRKDFSGFTGLALDMKFVSNLTLPYSGPLDVQVGLGFIVPGIGEDESLQVYAPPITLTDTYATYEISFDDLEFVQTGSTLANDLANNAFIKIRFLNTLESEGRGNLYYDEIYGVTGAAGVPGDYSDDGVVDAADYTIWRDAFENGGPLLVNEVVTPGEVTLEDYDAWSTRYGSSSATSAAVPEPAGLALTAGFIAAAAAMRLRRQGD
jgi:hypothetical protein